MFALSSLIKPARSQNLYVQPRSRKIRSKIGIGIPRSQSKMYPVAPACLILFVNRISKYPFVTLLIRNCSLCAGTCFDESQHTIGATDDCLIGQNPIGHATKPLVVLSASAIPTVTMPLNGGVLSRAAFFCGARNTILVDKRVSGRLIALRASKAKCSLTNGTGVLTPFRATTTAFLPRSLPRFYQFARPAYRSSSRSCCGRSPRSRPFRCLAA